MTAMGRPAKPPKNGKRKQSKRPSGRLTALILAALLLGLSLRLYDLLRELRDARAEELSYAAQLAELQETNKRLADDIENRDNLDLIEDIARDEMGMVAPGEKIFRFGNR